MVDSVVIVPGGGFEPCYHDFLEGVSDGLVRSLFRGNLSFVVHAEGGLDVALEISAVHHKVDFPVDADCLSVFIFLVNEKGDPRGGIWMMAKRINSLSN